MTSRPVLQRNDSEFLLTRPSRDVTRLLLRFPLPVLFLLTRPSRDVTRFMERLGQKNIISTHTSLAGRDRYI